MKKPLLLLVDDDTTVLEALEAELIPAFGDICRIEAFSHPEHVLNALSDWKRDRLAIAVAIVDQKMPRMTGVDLLASLREAARKITDQSEDDHFHPASQMRSIILTGYGGLESAVAAKNKAGSAFYLEKPWRRPNLQEYGVRLLSDFLDASGAGSHLVIRPVRSPGEILSTFELRYQVYRQDRRTALFVCSKDEARDYDRYDPCAHHLALFSRTAHSEQIVGCLRIVTDTVQLAPDWIDSLSESVSDPAELNNPPEQPLPLLAFWPEQQALKSLYSGLREAGDTLTEGSRLAVVATARGGGTAQFMARSAVSIWMAHGYQHSLVGCRLAHKRLWSPFGFERCRGTSELELPDIGRGTCLYLDRQSMPVEVGKSLETWSNRFERTRLLCHCSEYPECESRYSSPDRDPSDIFCPWLAHWTLNAAKGNEDRAVPAN
jgi:FixJ family two-component response regulator